MGSHCVPYTPASPPSQDSHGGPRSGRGAPPPPDAAVLAPLAHPSEQKGNPGTLAQLRRCLWEASEEGTSHRPLPTPAGCVILPHVPFGFRWPGPASPRGNIPKKGRKENSESNWPVGEDRRVRWEKGRGGRAPGKETGERGSSQSPRGRELLVPGGSGGGESALASLASASWKICGARGGRGGQDLALGTETGKER